MAASRRTLSLLKLEGLEYILALGDRDLDSGSLRLGIAGGQLVSGLEGALVTLTKPNDGHRVGAGRSPILGLVRAQGKRPIGLHGPRRLDQWIVLVFIIQRKERDRCTGSGLPLIEHLPLHGMCGLEPRATARTTQHTQREQQRRRA